MIDIFYIEDDRSISRIVKEYLEQRDYHVSLFESSATARAALERGTPQLILLDWNLPDGNGDVLCGWIRSRWPKVPIIFLTVRGDTQDIVNGFQNGADDYVVKPFELEVLYSRICALLRRAENSERENHGTENHERAAYGRETLVCGSIVMDKSKMTVSCDGKDVKVSQAEYEILRILMENQGKTITRQRLLEQIWDQNGNYVNDNTLTVAMKRLREKLNQPSCLKTIRSFGYRMEEPCDAKES